ncbi:MAG TPA: PhoPQ-activated protein PqaA family protein [Gemmataceae bacterium]|jgi:PhoPQ-activated pathogenicity-related protein|nr:PhoPQ-activated protein PqaA family protein [Gemmataceae bacterium]
MRSRIISTCCLALFGWAATARADLAAYIAKPDSAYKWELTGKTESPLGTVYDLKLVSQIWQGITWEHGLQIYVANGVKPTVTMFLWNQGGKPSQGSAVFGLTLSAKIRGPVAFLYGIPNQPLFGGKKEDALIAETFVRYLETRDDDWPLLFPMVKSLVRAMDALQAFGTKEWKDGPTAFVVSGASKRGWTTWLTGASDPRVKAIAPLVIDTLNFPAQLPHQVKSFGTYSEMIGDYTRRGLVPLPNTDAARNLWRMTDPYTYRDKLTMPKFILVGANDPYWTVDASNFYWDGLKGEKWLSRVPNAGHDLEQKLADGRGSRNRAVDSLAAFGKAQVHGKVLASATWADADAAGKPSLAVRASAAPAAARVWVADAPSRDFRKAMWTDRPATIDNNTVTATVDSPSTGFRAFYAELDYDLDGLTYRVCSGVRVVAAEGGSR